MRPGMSRAMTVGHEKYGSKITELMTKISMEDQNKRSMPGSLK
jgi:hypothetical protein